MTVLVGVLLKDYALFIVLKPHNPNSNKTQLMSTSGQFSYFSGDVTGGSCPAA